MAIYDDGTMDVLKDGKVERRKYSVEVEHERRALSGHPGHNCRPLLYEGEDVQYFVGSPTPHIIQVKWPEPARCNELRSLFAQGMMKGEFE